MVLLWKKQGDAEKKVSDSKQGKKQSRLKISELILSAKNLSFQVERLRRERFLSEKVVDLAEYRTLRKTQAVKAVLVIDDDRELEEPLSKALEKRGFRTLFATDAEKLAGIIEGNTFDLALVNPGLDWVDGFEFCQLIKGNQSLRGIPIILISPESGQPQIRKGFEAGCDEYLTKPFKLERLVRTIKYFLVNY